MPPMYLNLVAIAALIAIASVMHKVPQIGTDVSVNIWISERKRFEVFFQCFFKVFACLNAFLEIRNY